MEVIRTEKPFGVVVAFGGQTAIKLANFLEAQGCVFWAPPADSIDAAEDRERFDALLEKPRDQTAAGHYGDDHRGSADRRQRAGLPVLMRPSYVLGGQNMIIAFCDEDIREYMAIILSHSIENPVLIDKYLMGIEIEVDAICDGEDILIPGIMEHIERAGIHSGDSIAVYPAWNVSGVLIERLIDYTRKLALSLRTQGLVNIQYVIHETKSMSSRSIPVPPAPSLTSAR